MDITLKSLHFVMYMTVVPLSRGAVMQVKVRTPRARNKIFTEELIRYIVMHLPVVKVTQSTLTQYVLKHPIIIEN